MRENNCPPNLIKDYLEGTASHPRYSPDWRFLPGLPGEGKTLIIAKGQENFTASSSVVYNPPADQKQRRNQSAQFTDPSVLLQEDLQKTSFPPDSFDLVALPYGFPGEQTGAGQKLRFEYCCAAYRLTKPGGALYMGFANRWSFKRIYKEHFLYNSRLSPRRISRLLRSAGYTSVTFYGAIPDHNIPRYIFPLKTNTVGFVVQRHYGRKLPGFLASFLSKHFIALAFQYLLPSYLVVAKTRATG